MGNLLSKYDDITIQRTSMKGYVLLQAGRDGSDKDYDYEISMTVPEAFANQVLKWKSAAEKTLDKSK